ncbi:aminotransferase class IV [Amycolatopsis thermoflava]|uniref:aminotransferase class IV n=1 Tax=Amycolatopsis thermoflava TaxID=84480 RepID=UPI003EB736DC
MSGGKAGVTVADRELAALVNGRATTVAEVTVPAMDTGFTRGDGVFEVFRLYDGVPFMLQDHLDRLARSAAALKLDYDVAALERECRQICRMCRLDSTVRVIATRPGLRLALEEINPVFPEAFAVYAVPHLVSPLMSGIKSLSYGANLAAHLRAIENDCDTGLFVTADSKRVLEGSFSNFVWASDGKLYTPPLTDGVLDGITRQVLLQVTGCEERSCSIDDVMGADGAMLTGTGFECRPISRIDGLFTRVFDTRCLTVTEAVDAVAREVARRVESQRLTS